MAKKSRAFRLAHSHSNEFWRTKLCWFILTSVCVSSLAGGAFAATSVRPVVETDPSRHGGDTADDSVIWIHPTNPSLSLVIGDDKSGGLMVWGLDGRERQYVNGTGYTNVDLRYNFPLAGRFSDGTSHTHVALVGVGDGTNREIDFFKVNPATRALEPAGSVQTLGLIPYGSCMYHSPLSGKYYYFVNAESGVVQQFDLSGASGMVGGQMVRQFDVGTQTEGCVADDELGYLYIGEERVGIWKYGAEPGAGATRTQVDTTGHGSLVADVEGLTIYYNGDGTGYLIASSQGDGTFAVYTREGINNYLGSFQVDAGGSIDGVSGTDGIDVTNFPLGSGFPNGLLVVHDDDNSGATASNQKFIAWELVANVLSLRVDTSWDARRIGAPPSDGNPPPPPPSNGPPSVNPDAAATTSGSSVTIAVLANDTDPDNHRLSITATTNGRGGSVSVNADGTVTYTANAGFSGTDTFNYTISDGNGGSDTGTVTVTVNPPPPPPPHNPPPGAGSTEFYFPQIADGPVEDDEVFRTLIILSNAAGTPATGSITLKLVDAATNNAVSGAISFRCLEDDQATCAREGDTLHSNAQGVLSFRIAANGQVVLMMTRKEFNIVHGYAKVTSDEPISGMALVALYEAEYEDDGSVDLEEVESQAAVKATGKMRKFAVTDFRSDSRTALAVTNLGTEATTLTLRRFTASGAETGRPAAFTLAQGEHRAFFLDDVLSTSSGSLFGMVIIESSNAQVTAVALKFDDDHFNIAPVIEIE
jgi:3-phytase